MSNRACCVLGLSALLVMGASAQVTLIGDDFSSGSTVNGQLKIGQSETPELGSGTWRGNGNWTIDAGLGTMSLSGTAGGGEGGIARLIDLAGITNISLNQLTLSMDFTTTSATETLYVHLRGFAGGNQSATKSIFNEDASNGNAWDETGSEFVTKVNLNSGVAFNSGTGTAAGNAVTVTDGVAGAHSITNTFDMSAYGSDLSQYDYLAVIITRNGSGNPTGVSIDSIALTVDPGAVVADASVTPEELVMDLGFPATVVTGTVDFSYVSLTNMDVNITITNQSPADAFELLTDVSAPLTNNTTELAFKMDNATAGLVLGETATGLVTIAWTETGGGASGQILMPIRSTYDYAAGLANAFNATVDSAWSNAANWDLARVPGVLAEDLAVIESALTANVSTDSTTNRPWSTMVRGAATLNIGADFMSKGNLSVGDTGEYGFVNQTTGSVNVDALTIGDGAALSNSVYTLSDGSLTNSGVLTIKSGGVMKVTGGSMTVASSVIQNGTGTVMNDGSVLEISGGTYLDTSRIDASASATIRIVGDAADVTVHQIYTKYKGTVEFVLDETGVSTLKNDSWGQLNTTTFNIDGAAYVGGAQEILLYSGNWNNGLLGSDYAVTNLGVEGIDWEIVETNAPSHTVTLKILGESGYAGWAASYNLAGADATEDYDYDGDLFDNLTEYALGGNPTNDADRGYVPTFEIVGDYFEYVYARRLSDSNLTYTAEFGTDLVNTNWDSSVVTELPITGSLTNDFESVTNQVDMTGRDTGFMQLLIESL